MPTAPLPLPIVDAPEGEVAFELHEVGVGGAAQLTVSLEPGTTVESVHAVQGGTWVDASSAAFLWQHWADFSLADGGVFDADGTADGVITGRLLVGTATPDDADGVDEDPAVDGNGDGTPDAQQGHVTTLPAAAGGGTVTIEAPDAIYPLEAVSASVVPTDPAPPAGASFPAGLLGFTVELPAGADPAVDVVVHLPSGTAPTSVWKLLPSGWQNFSDHADIDADVVTLHLVDGGAGDADGERNGRIVDPVAFGVNLAPHAVADAAATNEDTSVVIDVLANDDAGAGESGQSVAVTSVSNGARGAATLVTSGPDVGKVRYVPTANVFGSDSFTYTICDTGVPSSCATGTAGVEIAPVNDAPRARLDGGSVAEDGSVVLNVLANDTAGPGEGSDVLAVTSVSDPPRGTASVITSGVDAGKVRYVPDPNATDSTASPTPCATADSRGCAIARRSRSWSRR